jgi:hypothetical protein
MSAKVRINITVDRETLRLADREARRRKTSRSALIRDTIREISQNQHNAVQEQARRLRRQRAAESMDRLARVFGDWPAEKILYEARHRWDKSAR